MEVGMRGDQQDTQTPVDDEQDTEGHAFKWQIQEDAKGRKRLAQGWDPDSPPPGAPPRPTKTTRPESR
jgi:hypothetical protein